MVLFVPGIMATCPACDREIPQDARYCPYCGIRLNDSDEAINIYLLREEIAETRHMEVIAVLGILMSVVIVFVGCVLISSVETQLIAGLVALTIFLTSLTIYIHNNLKRKRLLRKLRQLRS